MGIGGNATGPGARRGVALFAGVAGVPLAQYVTITTLANIGISALYCAAGAKALHSSHSCSHLQLRSDCPASQWASHDCSQEPTRA